MQSFAPPEPEGFEETVDPTPEHDLRVQYEQEAWRHVLSTEQGRSVINSLLAISNFTGTSFTGQDAHTNFREGMRYIGMSIFNVIQHVDPSAFQRMRNEAVNRAEMFKQRAENESMN